MKLSLALTLGCGLTNGEKLPTGNKLTLGKMESLRTQFKAKNIDYSNEDLTRHLSAKFGDNNEAITNYMDAQVEGF